MYKNIIKFVFVLLFSLNSLFARGAVLDISVNDINGSPAGGVVFQIFPQDAGIDDIVSPITLGGAKDGYDNDGDGQVDESLEEVIGYATFPDGKLSLNLKEGSYKIVGFSQTKHFLFVRNVSVPGSVTINAADAVPVNISCLSANGSPITTAEVFFRPTKRARASVGYSNNQGNIKAYVSAGEYNIVLWAVSGEGPHYLVLPNRNISKPETQVSFNVSQISTAVIRFDLPQNYALSIFEVLDSTYTSELAEGLEPEIGYDAAYTDFYPVITHKMPYTISANINYNFSMSFAIAFGKAQIYAYEFRPSIHLIQPGEMRIGTTEKEKFSPQITSDRGNNPAYNPGDNVKLFYHFVDSKGNAMNRILNYTGARLIFPSVTVWDPNGTPIANNIDTIKFTEFEFALPKSAVAGEYKANISLDAGLYGFIESEFRFKVQSIADNDPPIIEIMDIPDQIEAGEQFQVRAKITDELGKIKQRPLFRISNNSGAFWVEFSMTESETDTYQTLVPPNLAKYGQMDWEIVAIDSSDNTKKISSTIQVIDTKPPSIDHNIITKAEFGENLRIEATIIDNSSVDGATLFYKLGNDEPKSLEMLKNGNSYSASIDASEIATDGLDYYISATDLAGNTAFVPSEDNLPKFAQVAIQDTKPPIISHTPVKLAIAGLPLDIEAIITDNSNYIEARVFYKGANDADHKIMEMTAFGGLFRAEIPARDIIGDSIKYHISARDIHNQSSTSPAKDDYIVNIIPESQGNIASLEITPSSTKDNPIEITAGDSLRFSAVGRTESNDLIPADVVWTSTDGVGYISQDGSFLATGKIIGDGLGRIIATSINNNIAQAEAWVKIIPDQPSLITLNPNSIVILAGDQMRFTACVMDMYGNPTQSKIGWNLDSGDGIGVLVNINENKATLRTNKAGKGILTAKSGSLIAVSEITVLPAQLSKIEIKESNNIKQPFVVSVGESLQFSATGLDPYGNPMEIMPVWSVIGSIGSIDANGEFAGGTAGTGKVVASVADISSSVNVEVIPGELSSISVSPYTAYLPITTENYKSTQQFAAIGRDIAGNLVKLKSISWTTDQLAGSISKDGLFTAITDPGIRLGEIVTNGTIYANGVSLSGKRIQGFGYIVIQKSTTAILSSIEVFIQGTSGSTTSLVTLSAGNSAQFEATGSDPAGRKISISPDWSVIGGIGNIDVNGRFTATKPGSGSVVAIAGGYSGKIDVRVTPGVAKSIKIKPDFAFMTLDTKNTFTVSGYDLYENVVPIDNVKWSVETGSLKIAPDKNLCNVELIRNPQKSVGIISAKIGNLIAYANIFIPASNIELANSIYSKPNNSPYYLRIAPEILSIPSNTDQQFTAQAIDIFGNSLNTGSLKWSVTSSIGTIDNNGRLSARSTETAKSGQVIVTDGKTYGVAKVMVIPDMPKPLQSIIIPDVVNLNAGEMQKFNMLMRYLSEKGDIYTLPSGIPTWRVVGNVGKINSTGNFSTTNVGDGYIEASISGLSARSEANVSFGKPKSIEIQPSLVSLKSANAQKINISIVDEMGNAEKLICASPDCLMQISGGLGSLGQNGLFSAQNTGYGYIFASSSDVFGKAEINITQGNIAGIKIIPERQQVVAGGIVRFTAVGKDSAGNVIAVSPVWESPNIGIIGTDGTFIADQTGIGSIRARFGDLTASAEIEVIPASPAFILVDPSLVSVSSQSAESRQFNAIFKDIHGNNITNISDANIKWEITEGLGRIDPLTGVFVNSTGLKETRSGYVTFTAKFYEGTAKEFSLIGKSAVILQSIIKPLVSITITPNPVNAIKGDSQKFAATGKNSSGLEIEINPQWRVVNAESGTEMQDAISADGLLKNTANMTVGSKWRVIASAQNSEGNIIQGEALVSIITGPLQTIKITCTGDVCNKPIESGSIAELSATGYDSFQNAINISPSWKLSGQIGTIRPSGNKATFVAGLTGSGEIVAQSEGKEGKVPISVIPGRLARIVISTDPPQADNKIGSESNPLNIKAGLAIIFKAAGYDSSVDALGKSKPVNIVNIKPEWTLSPKGIGTISADGKFTAREALSGTIIARAGEISSSFYVIVKPGDLSSIKISPSPVSLISGRDTEQKFSVTGYDQYANQITDIKPSWQAIGGIGNVDQDGLLKTIILPAGAKAVSGAVIASQDGIEGSANVTVVIELGELSSLSLTIDPATIQAGGRANCIVKGFDDVGYPIAELPQLSVSVPAEFGTLSPSGNANTWTFRAVELLPDNRQGLITAMIDVNGKKISAEEDFSLAPAPLNRIAIEPSTFDIKAGEEGHFTASGFDAYGNIRQLQSPIWTVLGGIGDAIVNSQLPDECVFKAKLAGEGALLVSSGNQEGKAKLTVLSGKPESLVINPKSIELKAGLSQKFEVTVKDRYGNLVNDAKIQWQVEGAIGSAASDGVFLAIKVGEGKLRATYDGDRSIFAEAEVSVVPGDMARLEISLEYNGSKLNPPYNLLSGKKYLLNAKGFDSHDNEIKQMGEVVWKVSEDRGTIMPSNDNTSQSALMALYVGSGDISCIAGGVSAGLKMSVSPYVQEVDYRNGATINGSMDMILEILPMALKNNSMISISLTQSPGAIQNAKRVGYVFRIEPEGMILTIPAKLKLPYGYVNTLEIDEGELSIYFWDKFQKKWLRSGGYVDTVQKVVITEINYFSQFAIMQEQDDIKGKAENKLEVKLSPNAYFVPDINRLTIHYNLSWKNYQPVNVTIDIYDMGGNLVAEIIRDSAVFPGWNTAQWNGKSDSGEIVRNGRYFVVITAESNGEKISKANHLAVFR